MVSEYSIRRRALFCDTDASGLVHFSKFFRYMEECEHRFLQSLNQSVYDKSKVPHIAWPRVGVRCDYRKALRFDEMCEIKLLVKEIGDSSITYQFQFTNCDDDTLCAVGEMVVVCVEEDAKGHMTKRKLPDAFCQQIELAANSDLINV